MSRSVAFFDLDHGILDTPAPTLLDRLVAPGRDVAARIRRLTDLVTAPLPNSIVTGVFGRALRGTRVPALRHAGQSLADEVSVQPYARVLIDEHRKAGRRVVATTQVPTAAAEPLAEALGLDDFIATRYHAGEDEVLDGSIDGPLVWGRGKLEAVRTWASANGASVRRSYLYAGANADAALLAEVGRPVVIDPDPRLASIAWLKGWPTRSLRAPSGVARIAGRELQEWIRPFARPELVLNARFEFHDLDHIPARGPAIVCGNHRSYFDVSAVGLAIARTGRTARFLGKKEVFDAPVVGMLARLAGGIRVERGTGSDEPLRAAAEALAAGELICLMPQGTIPRGPAFFDPELHGRWGAARLAAMTKAPVIPLGLWGTEKVWPRSSRLPRLLPIGRPRVVVRAGSPVELGYTDPDADTRAVMSAITDLLPEEAREGHDPTPEELRLTYPPSYKGDPERESERRPGTDN